MSGRRLAVDAAEGMIRRLVWLRRLGERLQAAVSAGLRAESVEGEGSVFTLELPRAVDSSQ